MTHFCNKSLRGTNCCSPYDAIIAMINNAQATADAALALAGSVNTSLNNILVTVADAIARIDALGSVMTYKGSVATYADLPATDNEVGDTYNVLDTGDNYAWTGTTWDKLSGVVDLSPYLKITDAASTYLTITNAASTYLTKADAANTQTGYVPINYSGNGFGNGVTKAYINANGANGAMWISRGLAQFAIPVRSAGPAYNFNVGPPDETTHCANKQYVDDGLATKQDTLVSGTNISTINGASLLTGNDISVPQFVNLTTPTPIETFWTNQGLTIGDSIMLMTQDAIQTDTYTAIKGHITMTLISADHWVIRADYVQDTDDDEIKGFHSITNFTPTLTYKVNVSYWTAINTAVIVDRTNTTLYLEGVIMLAKA